MTIYHFETILVANRGEIARRVIRACRRLGIRAVAVYSDADARSIHVTEADAAFRLGPAPAAESYLNIPAILEAARLAGAEAIHPGYGFLAENAGFARACAAAGLVFIGPSPEAIAAMGDKRAARALAQRLGVPVVPGYDGAEQSEAAFVQAAARIGYPIMVKAAAGGGGKGMRLVDDPAALSEALAGARREAESAFGAGDLLLERALSRPRHVEVQVLGDAHGNLIHLGERDCSIQRRHQKVIEESPAPGLPDELRAALGAAAVTLAEAIGYSGAGTVEFLVADGRYYFLEMNTRLQVEHPVTELVSGIDLVEWQLRVAAGQALPWTQAENRPRGHAIEARLYAEDAADAFRPSTGTVLLWRPAAGEGLRVDDGIGDGDEVTAYYDPLLAKIIAHGATRAEAIGRLRRALEQTTLLGLTTNLPLLRDVLGRPAFAAGELSTSFLADHAADLDPTGEATAPALMAVALARYQLDAAGGPGYWRNNPGQPAPYGFRVGGQDCEIRLWPQRRAAGAFTIQLPGGEPRDVVLNGHDGPDMTLTVDGRQWRLALARSGATWWVQAGVEAMRIEALPLLPEPQRAGGGGSLRAPLPGRVLAVLVQPGETVAEGQPLMKLEAMKMEHTIRSAAEGIVEAVYFAVGDQVAADALLLRLGEG
ncbi:Acetyl-/propionyl-coenzyme A carboxylase alpha chain [Includes: Biotin carboxylase; Biotin carboxyl carrier protein] [Candidatus Promineifilum breve]|uniref:biotin carboxylase n=1 Tax=Candidatus Promineifilum breve TaxID=1806508 RepID=A0A161KAV3_9CHLR|nr:biotin carboxylase N-terminal domain-containing protein [Candidatus Promineifilum breve]CUS04383.2 Acetyl-/propionyl-coenzyme A carboxylase alpha chain [Includes: Biotin carboxylase; Biotin carboxyl carrier protein] [Candidatus Promineifilum breve]